MNNLKHNTKHTNPHALKCEADNGFPLGKFLFSQKPSNEKVKSWPTFSELSLTERIMAVHWAQPSMPIVTIHGPQRHKAAF